MIRFDDQEKTVTLSVHDVLDAGMPRGHLSLEVVQRSQTRAALGRRVHQLWQAEQVDLDGAYQPEVSVKHQLVVLDWTVNIQGRLDGLTEEDGRTIVEEIKSTTLDSARLFPTAATDWSRYVQQLEVYLWILAEARKPDPVGRLVLVSLADGARHVIGVQLEQERVGNVVRERLAEMVEARERRLAWLARRRDRTVPWPFDGFRRGQESILEGVHQALEAGRQLLVEAPTGLGKTASVLHGALRHALAGDKQLFWATSRTTQQRVAEATLERFREAGLPLRSVTITAKEKVCLNDVVSCRPETCPYAEGYYDKLRENRLIPELAHAGRLDRDTLMATGERHEVCPFELALDLSSEVDVVIGDYNYVFDPSVRIRRHFADSSRDWVVVADEVHGLVERARGYGSPAVRADVAARAAEVLETADDVAYAPYILLAREIEDRVFEDRLTAQGPGKNGEAVAEPSAQLWEELAARVDEVGLDYALLKAERPAVEPGQTDPWLETARSVLRFASALSVAGDETVALVKGAPHPDSVGLLCLDPSGLVGPFLRTLGGFVGASATLKPSRFYCDLLGLHEPEILSVPSPFDPDRRMVVVAPRVSTAYRDRVAHADRTADLIQRCVEATPGNVAVYFPSFAMLDDITGRLDTLERELLVQERSMGEQQRDDWLGRLGEEGPPIVLGAVLGGIFAEGIDLPPGALSAVVVAGPALPPVGLERDLLRATYEDRYDDGFLYASLIPGLTRVVQAAGRLIRREDDRGTIVLVGRRFRWRDIRALLPEDWSPEVPDDPASSLASFWRRHG